MGDAAGRALSARSGVVSRGQTRVCLAPARLGQERCRPDNLEGYGYLEA